VGNPLALLFIVIGFVLIVIGFKGKGDNLIAGATGKPYGTSTLAA
jgi:hypothetical protein